MDHNSVLLPSRHCAQTMKLSMKEVVPTFKAQMVRRREQYTDGKVLLEEVRRQAVCALGL